MKNRLLVITRNTVPYVKELRPYAGSVTACILMQQLEFWFDRKPEGFFKFLEASPQHDSYREGDSWQEELGFSADEFRTAFDKIGVRHKSKRLYEAANDTFGDQFYCSYHDKIKGITWYFRNHEKVDSALNELSDRPSEKVKRPISVNRQRQVTEAGKGKLRKQAKASYGDGHCQALPYTEITSEITSEITLTDPESEGVENALLCKSETEPVSDNPSPRSDQQPDSEPQREVAHETSSAAAIIHPTKKTDDRFQEPPWGWEASEAFLQYIADRHLALTSNYREGGVRPTIHRARSWLQRIENRDTACNLWAEYNDPLTDTHQMPLTRADQRALQTYQAIGDAIKDL